MVSSAKAAPITLSQAHDRHDPIALAAMIDEVRQVIRGVATKIELDAHIDNKAFDRAGLTVFDVWVESGKVKSTI